MIGYAPSSLHRLQTAPRVVAKSTPMRPRLRSVSTTSSIGQWRRALFGGPGRRGQRRDANGSRLLPGRPGLPELLEERATSAGLRQGVTNSTVAFPERFKTAVRPVVWGAGYLYSVYAPRSACAESSRRRYLLTARRGFALSSARSRHCGITPLASLCATSQEE